MQRALPGKHQYRCVACRSPLRRSNWSLQADRKRSLVGNKVGYTPGSIICNHTGNMAHTSPLDKVWASTSSANHVSPQWHRSRCHSVACVRRGCPSRCGCSIVTSEMLRRGSGQCKAFRKIGKNRKSSNYVMDGDGLIHPIKDQCHVTACWRPSTSNHLHCALTSSTHTPLLRNAQ